MRACNGTGVIRNDIGMGVYQFGPCICEAANITLEEVDRRRHAVMAELREIHQLQLEGNGMPRLGTDLEKENYTIAAQQRKYMKKSRRNIYVALEDLDLLFDESEVIRFQEMWEEDKSFIEIAVELGRHQLEIASLIMDQADKNKIKSRPMGIGA
jgi:hypothetical protein